MADERVGRRKPAVDRVLKQFRNLLGQISDRELAQRAGVSIGTVRTARRLVGVTSLRQRTREGGVAPEPPPAMGSEWVWKVTYGQTEPFEVGYAVGESVTDAVTRVAAPTLQAIVRLERIGQII